MPSAVPAPGRRGVDDAVTLDPSSWPFTWPALLLALPLALLAGWRRAPVPLLHSSAVLLPADRLSKVFAFTLRLLAVLAAVAALLGMAGLHRPAYEVERVGQGAEIMLLVDRSLSMDQPFITADSTKLGKGGGALDTYIRSLQKDRPSKQQTARRMLAEFAAQRRNDRFAMIVFSTLPIPVLDFTGKPAAVQAAIRAGEIGRGLAETDIGLALLAGIHSFRDRPYSGSRIVMLVSDGGDKLDVETRAQIAQQMRDLRITLYWLYIRSLRSPGLADAPAGDSKRAETAPEYFLHQFFTSMGTPYRVYEAESPEALQRAMADVSRLEATPITYLDTIPQRDLAPWCYGLALGCVLLLLAAKAMELRSWR
jgi:mxaC protein